ARDERHVEAVFDAIEPFAAELAARGRPPGSRGAIRRMIGRALLVQHRVYGRLEDDYELIERAETLERKLAFISTAASALIDLKDADRSLRLEIIIILLILAEVTLAVVPLFRY